MNSIQVYLAIGAFILTLGSNITWAFIFFVNAEKKKYAAERDFNHLKNNQLSISQGISTGFDGIEEKIDVLSKEIIEIKAWLIRNQKYIE